MIIERLNPERKIEAVKILTAAFYDYKTIRKFLNDETSKYEQKLNCLIGYLTDATFLSNSLALAVVDNCEVVAVALIEPPGKKTIPQKLHDDGDRLRSIIGNEAFQRLEYYEDLTDRYKPDYPYYYIDTIGVHPNQQGKGYARFLLEKIREIVVEDQNCEAICLFTELPDNVTFYEHMGYRIFTEVDFDSQHTWCMMLQTRQTQ